MRILYLLTFFLTVSLSLWFPARNDAPFFERIVIEEALKIEGEEGLPPKGMAQTATSGLITVYDVTAGMIPGFQVRPQGPQPVTPELTRMEEAGHNALQTPFFRSLRSFSMMVLQRYGVILASLGLFMPFILVMLVDGFVHRRIRAARMQAPRPSLWRGAVSVVVGLASLSLTLPMVPGFSIEWLVPIPLIGALAIRVAVAYWHRFL